MELVWQADVGEHKGYIPLQFLKENHYSDETIRRDSKNSKPNKTVSAKVVGLVSFCAI